MNIYTMYIYTLYPADLRGRPVALLVLGGDAEHHGRPVGGGAVDVGVVQVGGAHRTGGLGAAVDPDEVHLARRIHGANAAATRPALAHR